MLGPSLEDLNSYSSLKHGRPKGQKTTNTHFHSDNVSLSVNLLTLRHYPKENLSHICQLGHFPSCNVASLVPCLYFIA